MNNFTRNRLDFFGQMFHIGTEFNAKVGDFWSAVRPRQDLADEIDDNNPYAIGGKRSFVPALGKIVWELSEALAVQIPFSARIYQLDDGRRIGYVRVPHYDYDEGAAEEFAKLIAHFENETEALVIDQVNNPGGSMFQMYAILSCLTDRPLTLPKHQLSLNEDDAAMASDTIELAEAGEAVPSDERPSPAWVAYSRFVLSEIEAGRRRLTNPTYLFGVTEIRPKQNHYTKRIFVLINELDFSAAEFFAAILQDNKRARLFGCKTAGAGGCVRRLTDLPGIQKFGIDYIEITWTIAWRTNGQPIEGKGVQPDVSYSVTAEDFRSGYSGYRQALLTTIGTEIH
jgi:hypothetical protein